MSEEKKIFSLSAVANSISKTIKERYQQTYWIKAEMNKLNHYSYSGHCYPELVEKQDNKVIAQVKAIIWKNDFIRIKANFSQIVKEELKDGIKILFNASIIYDAVHGLSLQIHDIDSQFSLGDLEFEKMQTIKKLQEQQIFQTNKEKKLPLLPKRIAIISVQSSKGYVDFMNLLAEVKPKYVIDTYLFPAILQGSEAIVTIIQQLKNIAKLKHHFDAVAIIRGGGGDIGLSCYNHVELCQEICQFPLPVLCGIGHATNETVSEMVAYFSGITPSKLAGFLIQKYDHFYHSLTQMQQFIVQQSQHYLKIQTNKLLQFTPYIYQNVKHLISYQQQQLNQLQHKITNVTQQTIYLKKQTLTQHIHVLNICVNNTIMNERSMLKNSFQVLQQKVFEKIQKEQQLLINLKQTLDLLSPDNILKRGYTLTLYNNNIVVNPQQLEVGMKITTKFYHGEIESEIKNKKLYE